MGGCSLMFFNDCWNFTVLTVSHSSTAPSVWIHISIWHFKNRIKSIVLKPQVYFNIYILLLLLYKFKKLCTFRQRIWQIYWLPRPVIQFQIWEHNQLLLPSYGNIYNITVYNLAFVATWRCISRIHQTELSCSKSTWPSASKVMHICGNLRQ